MLMANEIISVHGITYRNESKPFHYNYTLLRDATVKLPGHDFGHWMAKGTDDGKLYVVADGDTLTVKAGYSWDGCTHAIDADWNMRASLFHDALYQSKKCGFKTADWWVIDEMFRKMMKQDGASLIQRNTYYYAVRSFGALYKLEKFDSLVPA